MTNPASEPDTFDPIPESSDELLDPAWLERALDLVATSDRVVGVERVGSERTIAEKVHLVVTVEDAAGRRRTHPLCVKGHFDDDLHSLGTEAHVYRELLPRLDLRAPAAHHAAVDAEGRRGLIVMDDVIASGGRILSALDPYSLETCRRSLEQLASLHAQTWLDPTWEVPWLASRMGSTSSLFTTDALRALLEDGRADALTGEVPDATQLQSALARTADLAPTCVLHGDTHTGNVFVDAEGHVGWLDWQIAQRGHWSVDVAYHLGTVLDVETRRREEASLLRHYLEELAARGVDPPPFDEAWDRYAAGFTWGLFLWTITRISSREVVLVHFPRLATAVADHDAFARLGVR
jgi:aminoglycoside phosphotransferase (APT) family kinase protein